MVEKFLNSFWGYFTESSPYLLLGYFVAGIIHVYINVDFIKKHLGGGKWSSVLKATLFGIPLPLCSCSVIPAAVTLKKSGASNGATSGFLISTPETGVDSIAITYGLMGGPMAVLRPVAAFITSVIAGGVQNLFNPNGGESEFEEVKTCCKKKKAEAQPRSFKKVFNFGYGQLSDDIAFLLLIGFIAGSLVEIFVPTDGFNALNSFGGRLIVLAASVPLYLCASSSTPLAMALMMKGMSPGTAMIMLLAGPATNMSNLVVIQKYIGKKGVVLNIITVILVSLLFSYVVDYVFANGWNLTMNHDHAHDHSGTMFRNITGAFLAFLVVKGVWKEKLKPKFKKA
ncbi:MAG: SO_0444 family Cu/Zn efflux transporter [Oligoflexia bacterium]|nr:SO_0444 family Cu/Zn efflux transporter [Oligoflexia bacterium]